MSSFQCECERLRYSFSVGTERVHLPPLTLGKLEVKNQSSFGSLSLSTLTLIFCTRRVEFIELCG